MLNVNEENLITSRALGTLLSLTSERVRQLEDEGVFRSKSKSGKKYFDLTPSVQAYVQHLKEKIAGSGDALTEEQTALADLRYKTARAGKMELELKELQGTMHRAEDVELITGDVIAKIRAEFLALPGRLAKDTAEAKTAKAASAIIKSAVDEVLNNTAAYRYDENSYKKLVREREKWLSVKEAEEARQQESLTKREPAAKRMQAKTAKKASPAKRSAKRQPASSKGSAKASKPRKT
jgi:hypothetical protein